jgi:phosphate transport system permease protein
MRDWFKSGSPWIWLTAGAVAACVLAVAGVLALTALRGLGHFWPKPVAETTFTERDGKVIGLIGEIREREEVATRRLREAGFVIPGTDAFAERVLVKMGNRDVTGTDFRWFPVPLLGEVKYPADILTVERREWGNFYGHLVAVKEAGQVVASGEAAWPEVQKRVERAQALFEQILAIEKDEIGRINFGLERLRLEARRLELQGQLTEARKAELKQQQDTLNGQFGQLQERLAVLRTEIGRDTVVGRVMDGKEVEIKLEQVADIYRANDMSLGQKHYVAKLGEFIADEPREANTEGGIFPAIFGTVMMVLLMSGVRHAASASSPPSTCANTPSRGRWSASSASRSTTSPACRPSSTACSAWASSSTSWAATSTSCSTPSALPAPTFGTGGILWASLTLALLTVPVVIVSPRKAWRAFRGHARRLAWPWAPPRPRPVATVLPMASPGMMTGLILAVARAAGEVAPLMITGVVKLAPTLPLDGYFPFLHLERKFMHLGFHIYDVGFQSPNVEAARPWSTPRRCCWSSSSCSTWPPSTCATACARSSMGRIRLR